MFRRQGLENWIPIKIVTVGVVSKTSMILEFSSELSLSAFGFLT